MVGLLDKQLNPQAGFYLSFTWLSRVPGVDSFLSCLAIRSYLGDYSI